MTPNHIVAHKSVLIYPVLEGKIPTSGKPYKMNNWIGHTFDSTDGLHTIKTTTKSIIVEVNIELGNMSVANLIMRYSDIGKAFASKFAERYNLKLGAPEWVRDGFFMTESGISLDRSRLEMKSQRMGYDFFLKENQELKELKQKINSQQNRIDDLKNELNKYRGV